VVVFLGTVLLAECVKAPRPPAPAQLHQKLGLLSQERAVDLVFLGSSRTHFQFIPESFNAESEQRGVNVGSFNFGLPGAQGHEIDYLLERYIQSRPGLKYVFIEFPGFEYQTPDIHERTFRQVHWHDARRTLDSVKTSLRGPLALGLRLAEVEDDVLHFLLRTAGFWSRDRTRVYPMNSFGYQEWIRKRPDTGFVPGRGGARLYSPEALVNADVLKRQQARLNALGVEVYYVLPPGSPSFRDLDWMEREGEVKHVIRLNDPERVPELFDTDAFGTKYLLPEGARRYSEKLAGIFAETVRRTEARQPFDKERGRQITMGS
jgi:hypothetical protein